MSRPQALPLALDVGLLALLYATALLVVQLPVFAAHPELLGSAMAVDLVLTAALVHWFLGHRAGIPRWTVPLVAVAGAITVRQLVPAAGSLSVLVGLVALVELGTGLFALGRIGRVRAAYREAREQGLTPWDALEEGLSEGLESRALARAGRSEAELMVLGCIGPFRRTPEHGFAVHRPQDWAVIIGVLGFLSLPELVVLHVLLASWVSEPLAWIVSASSMYGMVWLWGDAQAMRLYPTTIDPSTLHLRVGRRWHAQIPRDRIEAVELIDGSAEDEDALNLSHQGPPNVRVRLGEPVDVLGLFGRSKSTRCLQLRLDDPHGFGDAFAD